MTTGKKRNYWRYTIPLAVLFTIKLAYGASQLADTEYRYVHGIVNERGPSQYFIIASGYSILLTLIGRCLFRDIRSRDVMFLVLTLSIPIFLALASHEMGTVTVETGYRQYLADGPGLEDLESLEAERMIGHGVAHDVLLMCGIIFINLFPILAAIYIACVIKENRRAKAT